MSLTEAEAVGERRCRDPECSGVAEPEMDGSYLFYECDSCGYLFGYQQVEVSVGACAVGVPQSVREAFAERHEEAVSAGLRSLPIVQTK